MVPGDVLDDLRVGQVDLEHGVDRVRQLVLPVHVPHADSIVIAAREQETRAERVPVKAVAFLSMTEEDHFGAHFVVRWARSVLEVVENVDLTGDRFRCNNFVHLGHVARPIDLALVINLQLDLNALIFGEVAAALRRSAQSRLNLGGASDSASRSGALHHAGLIEALAILARVLRRLKWDLDFDDLDVVLFVIRGMRSDEQSLDSPVAVEGPI